MDREERLERQIQRQPIFDRYPPIVDLDFAIAVVLERVEEMEYAGEEHDWCHDRPVLMTLLRAVLDSSEPTECNCFPPPRIGENHSVTCPLVRLRSRVD